uniref:Uncharacterized protein n=1 Tax=Tanacetum cinerariifolium TaxID=118510 RepID=A0A6L2M4R2_TANCI|nr:hypothetical protein [Tanacetum cinerariifolium]
MKAHEDKGDMDAGWDITIEDVRLRQILIPTIHTLPNLEPLVQPYMPLGPVNDTDKIVRDEEQDYDIPLHDGVMQPLTPQTVHITLPDEDYVAPATSPILNKQLTEIKEECSDMTRVVEKADSNPLKDVMEIADIIRKYDFETFVWKLLHQVCSLEILTRLHSSTWATKWFKRLVAYAKCNRDSYKSDLGTGNGWMRSGNCGSYWKSWRMQTPGSGISNLLVVGITFTGSGNNIHWQWELILPVGTLSWQWECLVHFIPNMDWLSTHKAAIICHEELVKIPLLDG